MPLLSFREILSISEDSLPQGWSPSVAAQVESSLNHNPILRALIADANSKAFLTCLNKRQDYLRIHQPQERLEAQEVHSFLGDVKHRMKESLEQWLLGSAPPVSQDLPPSEKKAELKKRKNAAEVFVFERLHALIPSNASDFDLLTEYVTFIERQLARTGSETLATLGVLLQKSESQPDLKGVLLETLREARTAYPNNDYYSREKKPYSCMPGLEERMLFAHSLYDLSLNPPPPTPERLYLDQAMAPWVSSTGNKAHTPLMRSLVLQGIADVLGASTISFGSIDESEAFDGRKALPKLEELPLLFQEYQDLEQEILDSSPALSQSPSPRESGDSSPSSARSASPMQRQSKKIRYDYLRTLLEPFYPISQEALEAEAERLAASGSGELPRIKDFPLLPARSEEALKEAYEKEYAAQERLYQERLEAIRSQREILLEDEKGDPISLEEAFYDPEFEEAVKKAMCDISGLTLEHMTLILENATDFNGLLPYRLARVECGSGTELYVHSQKEIADVADGTQEKMLSLELAALQELCLKSTAESIRAMHGLAFFSGRFDSKSTAELLSRLERSSLFEKGNMLLNLPPLLFKLVWQSLGLPEQSLFKRMFFEALASPYPSDTEDVCRMFSQLPELFSEIPEEAAIFLPKGVLEKAVSGHGLPIPDMRNAIEKGSEETLSYLLEMRHASVQNEPSLDWGNLEAWQIACEKGHYQLLPLLFDHISRTSHPSKDILWSNDRLHAGLDFWECVFLNNLDGAPPGFTKMEPYITALLERGMPISLASLQKLMEQHRIALPPRNFDMILFYKCIIQHLLSLTPLSSDEAWDFLQKAAICNDPSLIHHAIHAFCDVAQQSPSQILLPNGQSLWDFSLALPSVVRHAGISALLSLEATFPIAPEVADALWITITTNIPLWGELTEDQINIVKSLISHKIAPANIAQNLSFDLILSKIWPLPSNKITGREKLEILEHIMTFLPESEVTSSLLLAIIELSNSIKSEPFWSEMEGPYEQFLQKVFVKKYPEQPSAEELHFVWTNALATSDMSMLKVLTELYPNSYEPSLSLDLEAIVKNCFTRSDWIPILNNLVKSNPLIYQSNFFTSGFLSINLSLEEDELDRPIDNALEDGHVAEQRAIREAYRQHIMAIIENCNLNTNIGMRYLLLQKWRDPTTPEPIRDLCDRKLELTLPEKAFGLESPEIAGMISDFSSNHLPDLDLNMSFSIMRFLYKHSKIVLPNAIDSSNREECLNFFRLFFTSNAPYGETLLSEMRQEHPELFQSPQWLSILLEMPRTTFVPILRDRYHAQLLSALREIPGPMGLRITEFIGVLDESRGDPQALLFLLREGSMDQLLEIESHLGGINIALERNLDSLAKIAQRGAQSLLSDPPNAIWERASPEEREHIVTRLMQIFCMTSSSSDLMMGEILSANPDLCNYLSLEAKVLLPVERQGETIEYPETLEGLPIFSYLAKYRAKDRIDSLLEQRSPSAEEAGALLQYSLKEDWAFDLSLKMMKMGIPFFSEISSKDSLFDFIEKMLRKSHESSLEVMECLWKSHLKSGRAKDFVMLLADIQGAQAYFEKYFSQIDPRELTQEEKLTVWDFATEHSPGLAERLIASDIYPDFSRIPPGEEAIQPLVQFFHAMSLSTTGRESLAKFLSKEGCPDFLDRALSLGVFLSFFEGDSFPKATKDFFRPFLEQACHNALPRTTEELVTILKFFQHNEFSGDIKQLFFLWKEASMAKTPKIYWNLVLEMCSSTPIDPFAQTLIDELVQKKAPFLNRINHNEIPYPTLKKFLHTIWRNEIIFDIPRLKEENPKFYASTEFLSLLSSSYDQERRGLGDLTRYFESLDRAELRALGESVSKDNHLPDINEAFYKTLLGKGGILYAIGGDGHCVAIEKATVRGLILRDLTPEESASLSQSDSALLQPCNMTTFLRMYSLEGQGSRWVLGLIAALMASESAREARRALPAIHPGLIGAGKLPGSPNERAPTAGSEDHGRHASLYNPASTHHGTDPRNSSH